jgi:hypothetical protein
MNKQKVSFSELLTKLIFIPESEVFFINLLHQLLKRLFTLVGKLAAIILL